MSGVPPEECGGVALVGDIMLLIMWWEKIVILQSFLTLVANCQSNFALLIVLSIHHTTLNASSSS